MTLLLCWWLALVVVGVEASKNKNNLTVAVVANEFFEPRIGRIGGFGQNAKMVGDFFRKRRHLGSVVFVFANRRETPHKERSTIEIHGWPLVSAWTTAAEGEEQVNGLTTAWTAEYLAERRVDVAVLVDYRQTYAGAIAALPPNANLVLWTQDPRTKAQVKTIKGIRDPARPDKYPPGLRSPDATGVFKAATHRRLVAAVPWMPLRDRLPEAYGARFETVFELPNIIDADSLCSSPPRTNRSPEPSVLFLARLDPYKRPWIMLELARTYPNVTFHVAGKPHFSDFNRFQNLPSNVRRYDHADGVIKTLLLASSWFLVSTSAHEGLAISYLEALACGQPILAMVDPGGLVSRFGVYAGAYPGTGMDGLPALRLGFDKLLSDHLLRDSLAANGRHHVTTTHNAARFARVFSDILAFLGLDATLAADPAR